MEAIDRFFDKVIMWPNGCWMWIGASREGGYGLFWDNRKNHVPHVWAYNTFIGEMPEGKESHHVCKELLCANPYHIKPLTTKEHAKTKNYYNATKTHCKRGHEFSGSNLRYYTNRNGYRMRVCKECRIIYERERKGG